MSIIRRRPLIAGAILALAMAGTAFAFWTAGGSGSGTAPVGDTAPLTVNQVTVLNDMYPGDSPQTISGNFDNPNPGPIRVETVTASIASVTASGDCEADDFSLTDAVAPVAAQVATGDDQGAWTGPKIQFNNSATENQDGCKNATVNLAYVIG